MNIRHWLMVFLVTFSYPSFAQTEPKAGFADMVEKLSPAVVNVSTTQKVKSGGVQFDMQGLPNTPEMAPFRDFFERFGQMQGGQPQESERTSLGSGFIIDATGFVITNNHVIEDADEITVTLSNNDKYKAKIIGRDKKVDLALLKVEAKKPLPFVPLGDSDVMRVGDWVVAIGNPYGLGGTVTQGIISARQRSINAGPFDDFLQTDAPINRGNSGGPLFNTHGEVIGINTAIFSPSGGGSVGIGFAIPTALAKPVISQLKEFGRTHRGWLGVKIQEVSEEMADSVGLKTAMGALVLEVTKEGPAAKAGIVSGDIITQFDGKDISEMRFLPRRVAETKIGSSLPITYWHKGSSKTVTIKIGELDETDKDDVKDNKPVGSDEEPKRPGAENLMGMSLSPLNNPLRQELRLDESVTGLVVLSVKNGSDAAHRGLRAGDVISEINNESVASVSAFKKALASAKNEGRKFALIKVLRGKESAFVTLPISEEKAPK